MTEKRYTLDEARLVLAKEKCRQKGHVFHEEDANGTKVLCWRCRRIWVPSA